jgi:hypothetical protein
MQPNMSHPSSQRALDKDKPPRPTRGQRLAAFGFLGAFGLTILTVLLTGLRVGAPAARHVLQPVPAGAETGAPSASAETPRRSSSGSAAAPAQPTQSAGEPRDDEDAVGEDAGRDPGDATRKDSRRDRDARDSRANEPR